MSPHFRESRSLFGDPDEAQPAPLPEGAKLPSYLQDHRRRLRERFMTGGAAAMPDYELLELVLFRAIPRQDVKPLARRLLEAFGDFGRVLAAPPARLRALPGVGDAVVQDGQRAGIGDQDFVGRARGGVAHEGRIDVRILKDDVRRIAAQFHRHLFHGFRSVTHERFTHFG